MGKSPFDLRISGTANDKPPPPKTRISLWVEGQKIVGGGAKIVVEVPLILYPPPNPIGEGELLSYIFVNLKWRTNKFNMMFLVLF